MPNDLLSWTWWFFTAVIVAILVNIASIYLKPKIDTYLGKYSENQRIKNERNKERFNSSVNNILNDPANAFRLEMAITRDIIFLSLSFIMFLFGVQTYIISLLLINNTYPNLLFSSATVFFHQLEQNPSGIFIIFAFVFCLSLFLFSTVMLFKVYPRMIKRITLRDEYLLRLESRNT